MNEAHSAMFPLYGEFLAKFGPENYDFNLHLGISMEKKTPKIRQILEKKNKSPIVKFL
jgi:hypothetical protein